MPRVADHIVSERRRQLTQLLGRHRYLPVADVAKRLNVSEATARRDLAALTRQKKVRRTFGGAVSASPSLAEYDVRFASFAERAKIDATAKRRIARAALSLVSPGMTVFIDAGTTLDQLAALMAESRVRATVVTHSLAVADRLVGSEHVAVHLLAGRLLGRQSIVLGPLTARTAGEFEYDLAFLGAEAVNAAGAFNTQEDVVTLQRAVAARAAKSAVCVTAGKFGKTARVALLPVEEVDLFVTDAVARRVAEAGVELRPGQLVKA